MELIKNDPIVQWMKWRVGKNKNCIIMINGGTGCQPANSKVMVADGSWKSIEDIKVGDQVLSPQQDGTYLFSTVTNTTSYFSQENYTVTELNRNHKELYTCSSDHQIPVYNLTFPRFNGKRLAKDKRWKISHYTAQKYLSMSTKSKSHRLIGFSSFAIPHFKDRKNCEIEPYCLGAWIGDGHFSYATRLTENKNWGEMKRCDKQKIHKHTSGNLTITKSDPQLFEEINKHYPYLSIHDKKDTLCKSYSWSINSEFATLLTQYGLRNKLSGDKFIPQEALFSDIEYRKRLLAGLIDTDGYCDQQGNYSYCTKSKRLAEDFVFLVYSLGGRASIRKVSKGIKKRNFVGEYYTISFYLHNLELPILLARKNKKVKRCYLASNRLAIDVHPSIAEMVYGFTIDSPSQWYITNNFMVTHNSGKSYAGLRLGHDIAKELGTSFTIASNVDFSFEGLLKKMNQPQNDKPGTVFLFEEVGAMGGGASFRQWQTKANSFFNSFLQTSRHLRQILILTTPQFTYLDAASRKLVHVQMSTVKIDFKKKICILKPYILQVNDRTGKIYFKFLRYTSSNSSFKLKGYGCKMPPEELIVAYEVEKRKFTDGLRKSIIQNQDGGKEQKRMKKINPKFAAALLEKGFTQYEVGEALGLSRASVQRHKEVFNT